MIVQNAQALQHLQANIQNMSDEELRKIQIHIEGRLVFPNLETPRPPKSNPAGRKTYGAVLVFPMNQIPQLTQIGMTAIVGITNRFKQIYHAQVPERNYNKAYKNIQENPTQENGNPHPEFYQGNWWVNTSSGEKHKPKIFKKINGQITEVLSNDPDLYFGQNVIFVVSLYPTGTEAKTEKKRGVSANLIGILILGGGERIGGAGPVDFDPNASFNAFSSMTADFSSGSTNMFGGGNQNQGSNPFNNGGQQNQQYTPPPSNGQFEGNGQHNSNSLQNQNGQNFQSGFGQQGTQTNHNQGFNGGGNFNGGQNNNNNGNGSNPFGGGLI